MEDNGSSLERQLVLARQRREAERSKMKRAVKKITDTVDAACETVSALSEEDYEKWRRSIAKEGA